jgi:hypothetical protein
MGEIFRKTSFLSTEFEKGSKYSNKGDFILRKLYLYCSIKVWQNKNYKYLETYSGEV